MPDEFDFRQYKTIEEFEIFSRKMENLKDRLMKDASPALQSIGFSEEEANIMLLGALEKGGFSNESKPEDLVSLALRTRGDTQ